MGSRAWQTPQEIVLAKVEKDPWTGCWTWLGAKVRGRGVVWSGNGRRSHVVAARFAYEAFVGPIAAGLEVCHRCDNEACVNPDHLFLGTHAENMADMARKGRGAKPGVKLTAAKAAAIRASGESLRTLAARYAVTESTIFKIRHGIIWRLAEPNTPPSGATP